MAFELSFERAYQNQVRMRQKKLADAKYPYIAALHKKALDHLEQVVRVCQHDWKEVSHIRGSTVVKCPKCKFGMLVR